MKDDNNLTDNKTIVVDSPKTELKTPVKMIYRYMCPACTNIAFFASNLMPFSKINCISCHKELTEYKEENYITLIEG